MDENGPQERSKNFSVQQRKTCCGQRREKDGEEKPVWGGREQIFCECETAKEFDGEEETV